MRAPGRHHAPGPARRPEFVLTASRDATVEADALPGRAAVPRPDLIVAEIVIASQADADPRRPCLPPPARASPSRITAGASDRSPASLLMATSGSQTQCQVDTCSAVCAVLRCRADKTIGPRGGGQDSSEEPQDDLPRADCRASGSTITTGRTGSPVCWPNVSLTGTAPGDWPI
jgi:hypothetical protein